MKMSHRLHLPRHLWFAVTLAVSVPSLHADDAALRRQIAGRWTGAVVDGDGSRGGATRYTLREVVITPEKITAHDSDGRFLGVGTYTLRKDGERLMIDATGIEGPSRGQTMLGIWQVEGDTLRWCSGNHGRPRPAEFRTRTPDAYLLVLKRKKD